ncbi:V-type ATP synthase subunit B [Methanosarcinales archaeon]|nr:MAG: V-type ATP synthase subunit B [Methanosarcinales archaeon]
MSEREFLGLQEIWGPIVIVETSRGIGSEEMVEIYLPSGERRLGKVLRLKEDMCFVQVFGGTKDLSPHNTTLRFLGRPFLFTVSEDMLGRIFDGKGKPIDGGPPIYRGERLNVNGYAINPQAREYPDEFIQTGISAIDGLNSITRGQKIGMFSGAGLPHNKIVAQLLRQAEILKKEEPFCVILAGIGLKREEMQFFIESFRSSEQVLRSVMFLNLADDPPEERILTPRLALTLAEYLAFHKEFHVLVILTDMTNYCQALREISSFREEVPSRKGYPGYMYTDLASLYERTGRIKGKKGSITQIPVLTMPNMDITHPIPDLTGYITEGQIVLSLVLHQRGIYPPIDILPSLSRLMKDGIGENKTREDHVNLASQLYYSYARSKEAQNLASIIGEEELSPVDKSYLEFGRVFEREFINQGFEENRSIEETLKLGWKTLRVLPKKELTRLTKEEIDKFYFYYNGRI